MKIKNFKTFIFSLCFICMFLFSGCNREPETETNSANTNETSTQTQPESNNLTYLKIIVVLIITLIFQIVSLLNHLIIKKK